MLTVSRYLAALARRPFWPGPSPPVPHRIPPRGRPPRRAPKPTTLTIATSFSIGDLDPIENGYWGQRTRLRRAPDVTSAPRTVKPWLLKSLANISLTTWVLTQNSGIRF